MSVQGWILLLCVIAYAGWLRIKIASLRQDIDHYHNEFGRYRNEVFGFVERVNRELDELRTRR